MKIQHPLLVQAVGSAGSFLVRQLGRTLKYHFRYQDPQVAPEVARQTGQRYIYAFFHEVMLFPAHYWSWPEMHILISDHRDGELITQVIRRLGFTVIRGSTTRGGTRALRQMTLRIDRGHLCVTPDGPRGPRRSVHQGIAYLGQPDGSTDRGRGDGLPEALAGQELGPLLRPAPVQPRRLRGTAAGDRPARCRPRDHRSVPPRSRKSHADGHDRGRSVGRRILIKMSRIVDCVATGGPVPATRSPTGSSWRVRGPRRQ